MRDKLAQGHKPNFVVASRNPCVGVELQQTLLVAIALLQSLQASSPDGRVKRLAEEAVGRVQKALGSDKDLKALQEAIDKLQQGNQALRSRLEALEAKSKRLGLVF